MTHDPKAPSELSDEDEKEDPVVEECIRDALQPYLGVLSPEELADHRQFLIAFITTHPVASPLYERLRQRRDPRDHSDDVVREGAQAPETEQAQDDGTSGRKR